MRRIINLLVIVAIVGVFAVAFIPEPAYAMTGSGTQEDPYLIYDVDDLQDMDQHLNAWYILANDIDASATSGWNGGAGFDPIGTSSTPFTGHFNGNYSTISDLYIYRPAESHLGLFGWVQGISGDHTTIGKVTVTIDVTGEDCVGGLIGYAYRYVDVSYCAVGQVGNPSSITGASSGSGQLGGLIGIATAFYNYETNTIQRCVTYVDVDGGNPGQTGGFIGRQDKATSISQCAVYGTVTSHYMVGGFVGVLVNSAGNTITDCYSRCTVYVEDNGTIGQGQDGGGFIGQGSGPARCYAVGGVHCQDVHGCSDLGGFVGDSGQSCTACFWDGDVCELPSSPCGTEKTTPEMKTQSTFTSAGWDFDTVWAIGGTINDGYPYFDWWYNPPDMIQDIYQVVWFQPNTIIEGTILPNRAEEEDGNIFWGANPAGIDITVGDFMPEDEYDFEPLIPDGQDIIKPEPEVMTGDVCLEELRGNPLYPLVQILSIDGFLNERLVWLGLAWLIVIGSMLLVHLGFDTKKGTEKPQHFVLTTITGLGLSILFYVMCIFPLWVVILMAFGLVAAIIWERQPVM